MLEAMFEAPSDEEIKKVIITKDSIERGSEPTLVREEKLIDVPSVTA